MRGTIIKCFQVGAALLLTALSHGALAWTVTIAATAPKAVYLQIGIGTLSGTLTYNGGATPGNTATVNKASVTVPAAALGNKSAQTMTTDSAVSQSSYDGYTYCTAGTQLYIGAFYRNPATTGAAVLSATVPATLSNASGNTIPFSQISWTSGGNGDTTANGFLPEVFPGGTFVNGGIQNLGSVPLNHWAESCWTFSYANTLIPAVGTYTGRVLYTLTSP
jgi:hypothetical protein